MCVRTYVRSRAHMHACNCVTVSQSVLLGVRISEVHCKVITVNLQVP